MNGTHEGSAERAACSNATGEFDRNALGIMRRAVKTLAGLTQMSRVSRSGANISRVGKSLGVEDAL